MCGPDRDCAVWREAVQLLTTECGAVALVSVCRTGRTDLGSGNTVNHLSHKSPWLAKTKHFCWVSAFFCWQHKQGRFGNSYLHDNSSELFYNKGKTCGKLKLSQETRARTKANKS